MNAHDYNKAVYNQACRAAMSNRLDPVDAPIAETDMLVSEVITLLSTKLPSVRRSQAHAALLDAGWDGLNRWVTESTVKRAIDNVRPGYAAMALTLELSPPPLPKVEQS
jgi:hypothetical protein